MDQNLHQSLSRADPDENPLPNQKINKPSSAATDLNGKGCFDCNICLDSAQEPVVTLCGHLYCWPCIYKWLHVQTSSSSVEADNEPNCPVCKAQISQSSLIPLHGRGTPSEQDHRRLQMDMPLPRRPLPDSMPRNHPNNQLQPPLLLPNNSSSSTAGMCGEMLFARMFGPGTGLFPHPYANTYPVPVRRPETRVHKSLNRVSIFLFSCILLCLVLF